ncbi:sensor histidine kinase [Paraburkholderia fungorum]|uniref:sensor histidine kinase n=1 Tax=Paraburkholderia fungorum TaxID=134537 RepID=UPI0005A8CB18|nr:ATP-binding protein [Paraburkholderia fungorum]MBB5541914.1 signal transduction histidine kinase [Paraburkholderia fungorum]MBU7439685.1 HAMP domain-containing protein [Paraburkholderia fungorum]PNE54044.1 sensor histidine kinase [Paraburkholderia fungorum]PZR43352.1 MAG: HAMP domain-containing protein [Paraburkholderia fungorum]QLD52768.1 HAMP domain-containing protein [Paraburkholderia fungorum]
MRLADLHRTTGFRLATLFLMLFGVIAILLFGYLYHEITGFEQERIDDWLIREHAQLTREEPDELVARFEHQNQFDPRHQRPFGLFDANGKHLAGGYAGDQPAIPIFDQPFSMRLARLPGHPPARCIAARVPDSRVALQCQNTRELDHFDEELLHALLSTAMITLVIGLVGASLIGISAMRRLDAVTASIEEIVAGNLGRRLPVQSRGDDVDRLVGVVNGMLDEIERLMNEVKGVCDAIAHDLRTPLTRMLSGLERAQRRAKSEEEYQAVIDETVMEIGGLLRTFNALLRISEIESGVRRAGFTTVDLAAVANDVFEFYEPTAEDNALRFELQKMTSGPLEIQADPSLLFEALANLVDNAIKFAPQGGLVTVTLRNDTSGISVSVTDSGAGINPAEYEAVVRRFYRGEASRHTPGSGFGLSLAAAVANMHGMRLQFSDTTDGFEACLFLPRDRDAQHL